MGFVCLYFYMTTFFVVSLPRLTLQVSARSNVNLKLQRDFALAAWSILRWS